MGDDATASKKKIAAGGYTHWSRPRWIRMYTYNYEFGESYYRPQVRYVSTARYASDYNSSSYSSSSANLLAESRRNFAARRRALSPPKAQSFIERWTSEPFYGRGFVQRSTSASRAESNQRESSVSAAYRSSRGESLQRESSVINRSLERDVNSQYRATRAELSAERELSESRAARSTSELRSRRAQSEFSRHIAENSNYASSKLLSQINSARATSITLQGESNIVQERLRSRRARSLDALRRAEMDAYYYSAAGSSLMRSDVALDVDTVRRNRREQSVLSDIESRYAREGSLLRSAEDQKVLQGNYEYPRQHLVCNENCQFYSDPLNHRRFVIGNRYLDAAALGGFDVLFDPTVHTKTRHMLSRLSEERDLDSTVYESTRESSLDRGRSRSRYTYNTIY